MDSTPFSLHAARQFANTYAKKTSEKQWGQSFWRDFLTNVCGVQDLLGAGVEFEYPVRLASTKKIGFADVFWPTVLLVEHKSAGESLDKAVIQARDYLVSLDQNKRPPVFIVSDFVRFRITSVYSGETLEFSLDELPNYIQQIENIFGEYAHNATRVEVTADAVAAELMANLYVAFENAGYKGHQVSVFLVRILFLLFGDDTGMWKRTDQGLFEALVGGSPESGSGLGGLIQELFQVLNTPKDERQSSLSISISEFPLVNGGLFTEQLPIFSFTPSMRDALNQACQYDWSRISPSIFGAMFQTVKNKEARREMGEHYTSEKNILALIGPLFLNELTEKLRKAWDSPQSLRKFKAELKTYNFLDPACGCGNFLLVAYKRMRDLELKAIARLKDLTNTTDLMELDGTWNLSVQLSQFHGIEYEEWSSQIAIVAMFLADHQANMAMEEIIGSAPDLLPLSDSAQIKFGNALQINWSELCPMSENTIIMGNPPFAGSNFQTREQKEDTARLWKAVSGTGVLDYVANWYLVASQHIAHTKARAAFVSTNSITQGQQPPTIWNQLKPLGVGIDFAHRTFAWENDAPGKAAVHCVIIGFSARPKSSSLQLWSYATPKSQPKLKLVHNINAYLLDAPDVLITNRRTPLSDNSQIMDNGSKPTDAGFLSNISPEEAQEIREKDPIASKYLRKIIGAHELIHNEERYCLWLPEADPNDLRTSPELSKRLHSVKDMREKSTDRATKQDAAKPAEFQKIRQPKSKYLAVPRHSSEERDYVPMALFDPEVIANDALAVIPDATPTTFGILSSRPFNVWNKAISGRIKNDTRISNSITYNNFPFPELNTRQRDRVEQAAENVLLARARFPFNSLADLYDDLAMPSLLRQAHDELDREVLAVFDLPADAQDDEILAVLFAKYEEQTRGLLTPPPQRGRRRAA